MRKTVLVAVAMFGVAGLSGQAAAQSCSPGPNYNACMQKQQEQQRAKNAEAQRARQSQQQMQQQRQSTTQAPRSNYGQQTAPQAQGQRPSTAYGQPTTLQAQGQRPSAASGQATTTPQAQGQRPSTAHGQPTATPQAQGQRPSTAYGQQTTPQAQGPRQTQPGTAQATQSGQAKRPGQATGTPAQTGTAPTAAPSPQGHMQAQGAAGQKDKLGKPAVASPAPASAQPGTTGPRQIEPVKVAPISSATVAPISSATVAPISSKSVPQVDGTKVVPTGGSNVVPTGGTKVVPTGGSNVVPTGGSNVVPTGGSNVVPTGGSNVVPGGGSKLVPIGGRDTLPPSANRLDPTKSVRIDPATDVHTHPGRGRFVANRVQSDGSQLVVDSRRLPDGHVHQTGYRVSRDAAQGTQTRLYLDGQRTVVGRDYVTHSAPRGLSVTNHASGLRQAALPDGRPAYREEFEPRGPGGNRWIRRTVFATLAAGAAVALAQPLVQFFAPEPVNGVEVYAYQPPPLAPAVVTSFYQPLPRPVVVSALCAFCQPDLVAFEQPAAGVYAQPVELLGDVQIAQALAEAPQPVETPEVAALAREVEALRAEVANAAATNADLQAQIQELPKAAPQQPAAVRVKVPEAARQQLRKQVKQEVAAQAGGKPPSLATVIASAQVRDHIFQVGVRLDAIELEGGAPCALTTGDLIQFNGVPGDADAAAQMRVITSKPGSCAVGSVVMVGLSDLQDMLNAFSQRLEQNLQRLQQVVAADDSQAPAAVKQP